MISLFNLSVGRLPRTVKTRAFFFAVGDVVLWSLSYILAFLIRFDGIIPADNVATIPLMLLVLIPVKLVWYGLFRLYYVTWHLVGITEAIQLGKASTFASLTIAAGLYLFRELPAFATFPRSILILDFLVGTALVTLFRLSRRLFDEFAHNGRSGNKNGSRVLVVGAGAAGELLARSMFNGGNGERHPVGFIDDDTAKHGAYIHGLKVLGGREAIPDVVRSMVVDEVIIAIPSAPAAAVRDIVRYTRDAGIKRIKVLPSINELLSGRVSLQGIRDIDLEDLLGRELVRLDPGPVNAFLSARAILVTGAGGSIGAEIARQLSHSDAIRLILLDNAESALFELESELSTDRPMPELHSLIADVRDADKMQRVFEVWRPDIVYHAAAYKHVPLMEANVDEAVRTNIFGTLTVAEAALTYGTKTFVLISTDKAISPSSVMGATKHVAELLIKALNARGKTRFMAVRFGNVIGSRGSVIPAMKEQIRRGGPVTVTHPEMTRYFMSTLEAVALVLQASAMQGLQDIFTLDMGKPVKIVELAQELIRLSGFEPDKDIPIVFTGIRPGEKLHETLETPDEPLQPTEVPKIFALSANGRIDEITLRLALRELDRLSRATDVTGLRSILQRLSNSDGQIPFVVGRM